MGNRGPAASGRQIVIVGTYAEAAAWAEANGHQIDHLIIADRARHMVTLDPDDVHLVVMPTYWDWQRIDHYLLVTEVHHMAARGATLEWA